MEQLNKKALIKVIGIGGAGNNAVNAISEDQFNNVELIVANTDVQTLDASPIMNKIVLGETLTKGLGAGTDPEIGKQAAIESHDLIAEKLKDADLVFIAAGMGGGTGTLGSSEVAKIAKENGSLVVAVVTTPFNFEGNKRINNAQLGIEELRKNVDDIVIVSNNRLLELGQGLSANETFAVANNVLREGIRAISDLVDINSHVNLDFADVKNILKDKGNTMFGIGIGQGDKAAEEAAKKAIASPILETTIEGATDVIINISGGTDLSLNEISEIINVIKEAAGTADLNVVWGMTLRDELKNKVVVTIIATGYDKNQQVIDNDDFVIEDEVIVDNDDDYVIEPEEKNSFESDSLTDDNQDEDNEIPSFMK